MTTWMAKKRKKNVAAVTTPADCPAGIRNVWVQTNGAGNSVPMTATAPRTRTVRLKTWLVKRHAVSSSLVSRSSMNVGMNSEEMIPPAASSKIMLGMLLATLYDDISGLAPSANAVAHIRRNPVTRESVVAVDISAAERAMEGLLMAESFSSAGRKPCGSEWSGPCARDATSVPKHRHSAVSVHPRRFFRPKGDRPRSRFAVAVVGFRYTRHGR